MGPKRRRRSVASAIGKRTSKASVQQERQQPRLYGLPPVLCWRSRSVGRSVAFPPSDDRLAGLADAVPGGRAVVSLCRKAVVVVAAAAAAAARVSFLFSFVRVSDNGQIVCSASVAVVCGRRRRRSFSSVQVSLSDRDSHIRCRVPCCIVIIPHVCTNSPLAFPVPLLPVAATAFNTTVWAHEVYAQLVVVAPLYSTAGMGTHYSVLTRRPSVSPTLRVVHALRRWRLWSSSMERLSLRLRPSLSPPSTFRFFPLVRVRVRVRHRHCRLNALCTSTHRLLTIMPRRRRARARGRRRKLTRPDDDDDVSRIGGSPSLLDARKEGRRRLLEPSTASTATDQRNNLRRAAPRRAVLGPFPKRG